MVEFNDAGGLLVKLQRALGVCHAIIYVKFMLNLPVYAADINEHIDEFRTDFVVLHLHRVRVSGYVDLGDHIEQESLLYLRVLDQVIYHC